jgi:acyl-CoA synthetase (AMP-forming)/AMP-acid ligase II
VPEHVVFADEIPKTSVGKIDKRRLRQDYIDTATVLNANRG